ncbi:TIGR03086 family metal-binding protein [Pseudonocardia thermophila]|nr:TIGR03086 family metal-binding protein [Pseudonocardia thermophila]
MTVRTSQITDPRPLVADALTWVHGLLTGVRADQLDAPTPCPEFDVRTLAGHLVASLGKARLAGEGGDPRTAPAVAAGIPDDGYAAAYAAAAGRVWEVWGSPQGDPLLDRELTAPFGTVAGRVALLAYLNEALVHGWDLAVATGQPAEAPRETAEAALAAVQQVLPEQPRGGPIPFAPPVTPAPDAGPTERLANWCGRSRT